MQQMKRRHNHVADHTRSKLPRLVDPLDFGSENRDMVSASHLYHYMMRDPLVDWLKLCSRRGTRTSPAYTHANSFTEFIMNRGVEFEGELIKYIDANRIPVTSVSEYITKESLQQTEDLMKAGVPVIHSAPVKNTHNGTQGIIDLLVRSDCISNLVEQDPLSDAEKIIPAPKLGKPYHYIVIDIKFSTLPLRTDGVHLLNSGGYPAYKAQCLIYTEAVGRIQGYTAPYAFIMGRRWRFTQGGITNRNYTCLNRLGRIAYNTIDSDYKLRTQQAIQWVRDVRKNSSDWSVNPPSRQELYPNMCVDSGVWNAEKEKIADRIGEITNIWYVGLKHRNVALHKGVKSWRDRRCETALMDLTGTRAPIIDAIMDINRQNIDKIRPAKIESNMYGWKNKGNELYVDFETLADVFVDFDHLPEQDCTDMIFMIGVGYEEEGVWKYKNFVCKETSYEEEYRIMDEFAQLVADRGYPQIYNWVAEERFWDTACNRQFDLAHLEDNTERKDHISDDWKRVDDWADLSKLFQSEPIVIKDCFKFGLKAVAKAMRKHGMISARIESECNNGMSAMINAWKTYKNSDHPDTSDTMKDISKYNEFDVRVLWEILTYLRSNHTE